MAATASLPVPSTRAWPPPHAAAPPARLMTDIMSFQYPPPTGSDLVLPPVYLSDYQAAPPGYGRDDSRDRDDAVPRSLHGFPRPPPGLQPLHMSPRTRSVGGMPHDQHALLAAEKRRNKLGYHRTSVACGHCRRRKIRCLPAAGDVQGRCTNCIRLKKDCSFFPVDQQPPMDTRRMSRTSSIPNMAPPSSGMPGSGSETAPTDHQVPSNTTRAYRYGQSGVTPWADATKAGELHTTWRSFQTSPIAPVFSSAPPPAPIAPIALTAPTALAAPTAPMAWTTPASEPGSREDVWSSYPAPPRSLSFGTESTDRRGPAAAAAAGASPYPLPPGSLPTRPYDRKYGSLPDVYGSVSPVSAVSAAEQPYGTWQPYPYSSKPEEASEGLGWSGEHAASPPGYYAGR